MGEINFYFPELGKKEIPLLDFIRSKHRSKSIKLWFDNEDIINNISVCRIKDAKIIDTNIQVDNNVTYYQWDINKSSVTAAQKYAPLVSRLKTQACPFYIVSTSDYSPKDELSLFIDAPQCKYLPDKFFKFDVLSTIDKIEAVLKDTLDPLDLNDITRFRKTHKIYDGQPIYWDDQQNIYFYLDNLHKDHFEVFDLTGSKHLGEMSLTGKIDYTKKDSRKKIDNLL